MNRKGSLKRGGGLKRKRKRKPLHVLAAGVWHDTVTAGGCVMPGPHSGPVQGHHVITRNRLKREGLTAHEWDSRNGVGLCERHHMQHHAYRERLPRELLPESAFVFAADLGLGHVLDREYPESDDAESDRSAA